VSWRDPTVLGRTGLHVGRIGVGSSYGVPAAAIERAYHEHGVNLFYWGSIRRPGFGRAVKTLAARDRARVVVMLQTYDRTGVLMPFFVNRGLRALGIDHADILLLGYHQALPPARVVDAAVRLRERGRVRFLALSGHHRPLFGKLADDPAQPFDVLMFRYNAAHRGAETEILPHLGRPGRPGTIAYTATSWGQIVDGKRMPPGVTSPRGADCYRFALGAPGVDVVLSGAASEAELTEAIAALDLGPLEPAERETMCRIGDHIHGGSRA
jgi:predicted aldo/keto reductase-like oxidoreductase